MPYLSIIIPTNRIGGLDILFDSLSHQTFRDFELVLVDAFYKQRRLLVEDRASQFSLKVVHCEPFNNPFPLSAYCRFANTGICYAAGKIALFLTDYTWLPTNGLETHATFHQQNPMMALLCPHQYYSLPPLHAGFRPYRETETDQYVADLRAGKLAPFAWSIFQQEFKGKEFKWEIHPTKRDTDPKLKMHNGEVSYGYWHCKNESVSLEAAIRCKGLCEKMDESHCYQDTDFADRLVVRGGIKKLILNTSMVARLINARDCFPFPKRTRDHQTNLQVWRRIRDDKLDEINTWKLETVRKIVQRQRQAEEELKQIPFTYQFYPDIK